MWLILLLKSSTFSLCRYQIYATMASFYVPLCVMVVVYVKILRVVADKKKQMSWKHPSIHRTSSSTTNSTSHPLLMNNSKKSSLASSQFGRSSVQGGVTAPLLQQAIANNNVTLNNIQVALSSSGGAGATGNGVVTTSIVPKKDKDNANNTAYIFPTTTLHRLKKGMYFITV